MPSEKTNSCYPESSHFSQVSSCSDTGNLSNFYKQAFLQSVISTVFLDTSGRIISANKAFENLFGVPLEEFINNNHSFLTDTEPVIKGIAEKLRISISEKRVTEWVGWFNIPEAAGHASFKEYKRKNLFLRARFTPLLNESEEVEVIVLQHEDITRNKQLEHELADSNNLLNTAQSVSKTGHFSADLRTGIWSYSKVFDQILGLDSKPVSSIDDWGVVICDNNGKDSFREFINLSGGDEYYSADFRIERKKDGEIKWVSTICRIEKDSSGTPVKIVGTVQDITERKLIEQQLIDSSRKYQTLIEQASDGIFVFDKSGNITEVNEEGCMQLGYKREELLQKSIWDITEEASHQSVKGSINRMNSGENVTVLRKLRRKDGELIYAEISGRLLSTGDYQAIARDVTERLRLEAKFKNREQQFRLIFENMTTGVVFQNEIGFITMANPAAEDILGLTLEQLQGKHSIDPDWKAVHEDGSDYPGQTHPAMTVLRTGEAVKNAIMGIFNPKSKEHRWINVNSMPELREGETKPVGAFTTFEDITEIRNAAEALRHSEQNYRQIFNATSEAIFLHDSETGQILDVNETMLKMFGFDSKDEVLSSNIGAVSRNTPPYTNQRAMELFREAVETGHKRFEWVAKKKNGEVFWVEVSLIKTNIGGLGRVLAAARDISDRKKTEAKLREYTEELRLSNSTKDKFLSIIAHDLRSPFHTVLGLSEILSDDIDTLENDEIRKIAVNLHSVLKKQYDLVNDLLDWARVQSKDYNLIKKSENFDDLMNRVADIMSPVAANKGIILKCEINVKAEVLIDAQMIGLVMRNLISNSIKFSDPGMIVSVIAKMKNDEANREKLSVTVQDSGAGIPKEDIDLLFKADVRYTKKGTRDEKGSGLGLLLCHEVVKKHGGDIHVVTDTGKGFSVNFTIPAGN